MNNVLTVKPTVIDPKTGLDDRESLAGLLSAVLADNMVLLGKTLGCHWNITGPLFSSVHALTEKQYENLFNAVDDISERIRALGYVAPYAIDEFAKSSNLRTNFRGHSGAEMLNELIGDHMVLIAQLRTVAAAAKAADDDVTDEILTGRLTFHEDALWKLRALVDE